MTNLVVNIRPVIVSRNYYDPSGLIGINMYFQPADDSIQGTFYYVSGFLDSASDYPNNKYSSIQDLIDYNYPAAQTAIIAAVSNNVNGLVTPVAGQLISVQEQTFEYAQPHSTNLDDLANYSSSAFATATQGAKADTAIQPADLATAISGVSVYTNEQAQDAIGAALSSEFVYNDSANSISLRAKTFNVPSRTAGTIFQISSSRDSDVTYKIPVTSAATLVLGSRAQATLQYADNSGFTTNIVTVDTDDFGIASGLLITGYGTLKLNGKIPAGKYVKITTSQTIGTPTIGAISGQEVLL